jgi:hypothetical protein
VYLGGPQASFQAWYHALPCELLTEQIGKRRIRINPRLIKPKCSTGPRNNPTTAIHRH